MSASQQAILEHILSALQQPPVLLAVWGAVVLLGSWITSAVVTAQLRAVSPPRVGARDWPRLAGGAAGWIALLLGAAVLADLADLDGVALALGRVLGLVGKIVPVGAVLALGDLRIAALRRRADEGAADARPPLDQEIAWTERGTLALAALALVTEVGGLLLFALVLAGVTAVTLAMQPELRGRASAALANLRAGVELSRRVRPGAPLALPGDSAELLGPPGLFHTWVRIDGASQRLDNADLLARLGG